MAGGIAAEFRRQVELIMEDACQIGKGGESRSRRIVSSPQLFDTEVVQQYGGEGTNQTH